jgi:uncharacterized HhH-GPD family protein
VPPAPVLPLSGDAEADALLARDPLALLLGMLLDQQIPMERAFSAPLALSRRLGRDLDADYLARMDPEELAAVFASKPALHRFPAAMARRVQALCEHLVARYGGDAGAVWRDAPDGSTLLERVRALPGFGDEKARILVALLGKRFGVRPPGWEAAAGRFGEPGAYASVADIDGPEALERVREHKRALKAAAKSLRR